MMASQTLYLYSMQKKYFGIATLFLSLLAATQVPVREEPRHHLVFENDQIRILDVFLAPYDTTQFHVKKWKRNDGDETTFTRHTSI